MDVTSGETLKNRGAGTAENRVPRDRISNLPRDASFTSRVLYRAQDHAQEFDLSLFTYAPHLLNIEYRPILASFTIEEASDLFASALLGIAVRTQSLTPQEADALNADLRSSLLEFFLEKSDIAWRTDEGTLRTKPLTRELLLKFLGVVTENRRTEEDTKRKSIGELWWERIR